MDPTLEAIVAVIVALGLGGGGTHVLHRRRANGLATPSNVATPSNAAQEEVLRQSLHDQRHAETMRALEGVAASSASAATAAREAAEATQVSAAATQRIATVIDERLPRLVPR